MLGIELSLPALAMRGGSGVPVPPDGFALLMLDGAYLTLDGLYLAVPA
ncbi:hypothetical protein [Terrihabitans sp. B22-R8]